MALQPRLNAAAVKVVEDEIETNYAAGNRRVAVALELLLKWYRESVEADHVIRERKT